MRIVLVLSFVCMVFQAGKTQYSIDTSTTMASAGLKYDLLFPNGWSKGHSINGANGKRGHLFLPQPASMAFFCRMERQIENKNSLPLRMRLGHLDYVNYLERKDQSLTYKSQNNQ